ncbi:MAG: SDR family NAD(P)-dependent oxidoreductase [Candidatus Lokiarchaeota archaeon]|nr:SDR family NAD(P)-dependent oxidoreductase [Candidatus Lokiarchaeota archaeon]
MQVLVTGGAGFIGSFLVDELIEHNHKVIIFDILEEQVHGNGCHPPKYLNKDAEFIYGSVTDYNQLKTLVQEMDVIFHLAAMVGVGQSMYQIEKYVDHNIHGTANLLDILVNSEHSVKKLVIASSNTVYGEGKYECEECGIIYPDLREESQLRYHEWGIFCPRCGKEINPLPTDETTPFNSSSVYALSKQHQEELGLLIGENYGINTTVLRFFLVYGPRQSLSNPYTGVCAIFSSRLLNGKPPIVFEDGEQTRDFVNVHDIVQALLLVMKNDNSKGEIFNVGSGIPISIKQVAEMLTEKINPDLEPIYNNDYRVGDIRHCVADISKIQETLGYEPTVKFEKGIENLIEWIKLNVNSSDDQSDRALNELKNKGLIK